MANDLTAGEVMHRSVQTISPHVSLSELERAFFEHRVSGFPVVDEGVLVGVVTRSDIVRRLYTESVSAEQTSDYYSDSTGFHEVPLTTRIQIADRIGEQLDQLKVSDTMHRQIHSVPQDQPLRSVAQTMTDYRIHRILVTKDGTLLGLISALDIVRLVANGRLRPFSE